MTPDLQNLQPHSGFVSVKSGNSEAIAWRKVWLWSPVHCCIPCIDHVPALHSKCDHLPPPPLTDTFLRWPFLTDFNYYAHAPPKGARFWHIGPKKKLRNPRKSVKPYRVPCPCGAPIQRTHQGRGSLIKPLTSHILWRKPLQCQDPELYGAGPNGAPATLRCIQSFTVIQDNVLCPIKESDRRVEKIATYAAPQVCMVLVAVISFAGLAGACRSLA